MGAARTCSACPTALVGGILYMAVLTHSFDSQPDVNLFLSCKYFVNLIFGIPGV